MFVFLYNACTLNLLTGRRFQKLLKCQWNIKDYILSVDTFEAKIPFSIVFRILVENIL